MKSLNPYHFFVCVCFSAQNVTVDEILSSYKQACQKLNCKPIPKVLKQIQVRLSLTHMSRHIQPNLSHTNAHTLGS